MHPLQTILIVLKLFEDFFGRHSSLKPQSNTHGPKFMM